MRYFVTGGSGFLGQHLIRRLRTDGHDVLALARSDRAAQVVEAAGATPVPGELSAIRDIAATIAGSDVVVHAAADTRPWGFPHEYDEVNIEGTRETLLAAQDAGVPVLVHISTEAQLAEGKPLVRVDETHPRPEKPAGDYPRTKGVAEQFALGADRPGFRVVAVRPRLVWGPGDTTMLPEILKAARDGRWRWVNGGHYLTSTCHVANVCEGIVRAADKGAGGQAYFLTDGPDVEVREFLTHCAAAYDVELPDRSVPYLVAKVGAWTIDATWRTLRKRTDPPVSWTAFALGAHEVTVDDSLARRELGYRPVITRDEGYLTLPGR